MLSTVFIDRPRLSIVISLVITIAGAIAMFALPIAQFPDIVPPQVQVTARYPGAGATVVEQTIAQPIESQVVGVDKMLYMKSTAGNDGSYTLTISFAVGTDPENQSLTYAWTQTGGPTVSLSSTIVSRDGSSVRRTSTTDGLRVNPATSSSARRS